MSRRNKRKTRHITRQQNAEKNKEKENKKMDITTSMEALDSAILERDFSYQRPVNMNRVREIVAEFDPNLVNILKVSYRDGHYYVFDGSHTLEVLRILNGKEHFPIICKLYKGLTYDYEAKLFAMQNGNASRVGMPYKLRALEKAGDEATVRFLEATRNSGFEISPGERQNKKNTIAAVCKAYSVYNSLGDELYKNMLDLIKRTWEGEAWSVSQNMLSGMAVLFKTYGNTFSKDRFEKKLGAVSQVDIQREASKHIGISNGYQYAYAIASIFNRVGGKGALKMRKLTIQMMEDE